MYKRQTRKFDITSRLEKKRDGEFHFDRMSNVPRRSPRPLWTSVVWMLLLLLLLMFLKRFM